MRAATVARFGGPEVLILVDQPDPAPGPGQVVVAAEVADTLWLETAVRSGAGQDYWPMRPPYVPGNGVAGRVPVVGEGVDPGWIGKRVAGHTGNEGGYADHAVVAANGLSPVPDGLDLTVAAALLHDGPTALALFDVTQVGIEDSRRQRAAGLDRAGPVGAGWRRRCRPGQRRRRSRRSVVRAGRAWWTVLRPRDPQRSVRSRRRGGSATPSGRGDRDRTGADVRCGTHPIYRPGVRRGGGRNHRAGDRADVPT